MVITLCCYTHAPSWRSMWVNDIEGGTEGDIEEMSVSEGANKRTIEGKKEHEEV